MKRPQEFSVPNQQQQIQIAADMIQGCHGSPQADSQTRRVCPWDFIHDGHMNTGVLESSFWITESC